MNRRRPRQALPPHAPLQPVVATEVVRHAHQSGTRRGAALSTRLTGVLQFGLVLSLSAAVLGGLILTRVDAVTTRPTAISITGGVADLSPAELTDAAADVLQAATAQHGSGYTFEIVQLSSLNQRPGGPLIDIPHPVNRGGSLGKTDHYELATFIERGAVSPEGFWLEVRDGPTKDAAPDFEGATYELGTIVQGDVTYRNDGDGWYETTQPPGIGLDPVTVTLLPTMLRQSTDRRDAEGNPGADTDVVRTLQASTKVADLPGFIAVDGAAFTEFTGPLELGFDDGGRLVWLHGIARNTNIEAFDLLVDTTITFSYPTERPAIPRPDPIISVDSIKVGG